MSLAKTVAERLQAYVHLTRLDRPIGIYLVLWPTLWALWFAAEGTPSPLILLVFLAGVVLMRSAGCAINDYADRKIDGHVERTKERPLATGRIQAHEAVLVFAVLSLLSFALVLQLNMLTIWLSIPAVLLAGSYPFMKRYTHLPQAYLGAAFGWAVPMGFAAVNESVPLLAWLLFFATVFWALAYDTIYAMVDRECDLKIGVKSSAILFGRFDRLAVAVCNVMVLLLLWGAGMLAAMGLYYWLGLLAGLGVVLYQQWLIRSREREPCFKAFLKGHYLGLLVFCGLVLEMGAR